MDGRLCVSNGEGLMADQPAGSGKPWLISVCLRNLNARREALGDRWYRIRAGAAVLVMLAGSTMLPPSRPALADAALGDPIPVGANPMPVAVNPATNRVYVGNQNGNSLSVIDGATNKTIGLPISVGNGPTGVAVNPATNRVYVANSLSDTMSVIDGATNTAIGKPIAVTPRPQSVAVNPTTNRIYVTSNGPPNGPASVSVVDGATNSVVGSPITVPFGPQGLDVNPVTNRVYISGISDTNTGVVTVIDGATFTVLGSPIPVGNSPTVVSVNSVTNRIYVSNSGDGTVTAIDGSTNKALVPAIPAGPVPTALVVNPATNLVYVSEFTNNLFESFVTVIDGATNSAAGPSITTDKAPIGLAVNPVTNRVYVANILANNVTVIGVPLRVEPSKRSPGQNVTATWSSLVVLNSADFVGLFTPGAPNTSPLSRVFTNGTASAGGSGVSDGSVELPIPAGLTAGSRFEARLISGSNGATLALVEGSIPSATSDSYTATASSTLNVPAPGILANDADADGTPLQAAVVANPEHGTLNLQANGAFSYTPAVTFSGTDSFSYRAIDEGGLSATATVTITVTAAPVGANDAYTVATGVVLTVPAPGVLANDSDADSTSLRATLGTNPAHGSLSLQPDGGFTYTPAAGFSGTDSFTYRTSDQTSLSLPITVALTVTPPSPEPGNPGPATPGPGTPGPGTPGPTTPGPGPKDAPVATADSYTTTAGTALTLPSPGVLGNDVAPGSPSLQASVVDGPVHGALALKPDGGFTYSPNSDFFGTDSFTYRFSDGTTTSNTATVAIAVTPTPCGPRPRVQTTPAAAGGKLQVHIEALAMPTVQNNALRQVKFGSFQNARVTLNGQPIPSGETFTIADPANTHGVDFVVERVTPGQATTVPFVVVDGCGEWPTFVGGGPTAF